MKYAVMTIVTIDTGLQAARIRTAPFGANVPFGGDALAVRAGAGWFHGVPFSTSCEALV